MKKIITNNKFGNDSSRILREDGREYYIRDIRDVCAAALDTTAGACVTLFFDNGSTPISIDFETKDRAIRFFTEVSDEIHENQKEKVAYVADRLAKVEGNY